ncbi:ROK family transcriptional regulator, partial [Streptomyces sp. NPDC058459]|uniref:ROK family transcriptional regulator n=1 Tax=Streptomyces sp. NPDC058459 TaxID=3346508 RepID=UPI0036648EDF
MPASPSTARALNEQSVLRLLDSEGALTAGQLKTLTGLSRPTISDLLERLRGSGCVRVVGETGGQRRGPNAKLYGIATDLAHLAALDVRADGLRVVVADLSCASLSETTLPLSDGIERAAPRLVALLGSTGPGITRLHSVSVAVPGPADPGAFEPRDLTSPPAWLHELVTALQEELRVNVVVANATQLAAVAEHRLGAARDQDDFVLLWLGQWVSLAVVFRGTVRCGATGGAQQIGFLPVPGSRRVPGATDRGVGFHALVGATAVGDLAAEHGFGGAAEAAV